MSFVRTALAATACALGAVCAAQAGETPKVTVVRAPAAVQQAVKVARDKETGQLRAATPEESAALDAKSVTLPQSMVQIARPTSSIVTRGDGSMTGRLSVDDFDAVIADRAQDGSLRLRHAGKGRTTAPAAPAPTRTEEK